MLLRSSGHNLRTSAEREVLRTIKEKTCYIAADPLREDKETLGKTEDFRLPDGNVIHVSTSHSFRAAHTLSILRIIFGVVTIQLGSERYWAPEILFNPELIGMEDPGVHQVIVDSLNRTDLDLRKNLYGSIILSGGSTLCRGRLIARRTQCN
jgi:centractin